MVSQVLSQIQENELLTSDTVYSSKLDEFASFSSFYFIRSLKFSSFPLLSLLLSLRERQFIKAEQTIKRYGSKSIDAFDAPG